MTARNHWQNGFQQLHRFGQGRKYLLQVGQLARLRGLVQIDPVLVGIDVQVGRHLNRRLVQVVDIDHTTVHLWLTWIQLVSLKVFAATFIL